VLSPGRSRYRSALRAKLDAALMPLPAPADVDSGDSGPSPPAKSPLAIQARAAIAALWCASPSSSTSSFSTQLRIAKARAEAKARAFPSSSILSKVSNENGLSAAAIKEQDADAAGALRGWAGREAEGGAGG